MRRVVYVPAAGFGVKGLYNLKRLPPKLQRLVVAEMSDPESARMFAKVLQEPDAEARLAKILSTEIARAIASARNPDAGMSELGKSWFKKVIKKIRTIHKKVEKAIVPKAILKVKEKVKAAVSKTVKKVWTRYGNIIIGVLGAVLAPFTGGASLAAAALLTTANTMYMKKRQADKIRKINEAEAKRIDAEVAAQEAKLKEDLDRIYNENTSIFEGAGITRDRWNSLSLEEKLAVIEKINRGEMPASQTAANTAAQEAGVEAPTQTSDWMSTIQSASIYQQALSSAHTQPIEPTSGAGVPSRGPTGGAAPTGPAAMGPEGPTEEAPIEAPAGKYELYVEGEKVFETTNPDEMFNKVGSVTKTGDRFEVFLNGKSLGLKIRAAGGVIAVPPDQVQKVRGMTHGEVVSMIQRAANSAKGAGEEKGEGGGFPLWLLAIPAGVLLAKAA